MPHYRRMGDIPRKRHTLHRYDGAVASEELMGAEGFSGPSALLYHRRSPSAIVCVEEVETRPTCWHPNKPLRPHHLRTGEIESNEDGADVVRDRRPLLGNDHVEISWIV